MPGRWRLIAGLLLVLVVPVICPYIGMRTLRLFLRRYGIPLAALVAAWLAVPRLQAWRRDALKEPRS